MTRLNKTEFAIYIIFDVSLLPKDLTTQNVLEATVHLYFGDRYCLEFIMTQADIKWH